MFRITKQNPRQYDSEHDISTHVYFKGIFSSAGKNKGEEENEIPFKTI